MDDEAPGTEDPQYARRLARLSARRWKQLLDVQAPYRRYLRRLELGFTLDLGCGIGRNLRTLAPAGIGVDHNAASVAIAREAGLPAYTPSQFQRTQYASPDRFDALLASHVLEHMAQDDAVALLDTYLGYVRHGGRVVMITPQERGYRSDTTHRTFLDFAALHDLSSRLGLEEIHRESFPFPRALGRMFPYNEFVLIARRTTRRQ